MKKLLFISLLCFATSAFSQNVQVGDSVMVNRSAKYWMTGERISSWVYLHPHLVSQVGSIHHPNGILLNVEGAYSWIKEDEVTMAAHKSQASTKDTIILHDTIISIKEKEQIVYVYDTIYITEMAKEAEKEEKTEKSGEYVVKLLNEPHFQFYGDFNQYFSKKLYGAALEAIFGARLCEYAYIGGGFEVGYWIAGKNVARSIEFPVFVHSKVYIPIDDKFFPHLEMSLGANMGYRYFTPDETLRPTGFHYGVYAKGGIGIDLLKCLSLGIGYQYGGGFSNVTSDLHRGYIKIGFYVPN